MAFFVCNSKAGIQVGNQEADLIHSGFTEGSFLLLNGQKEMRSVAEDLISNKQ